LLAAWITACATVHAGPLRDALKQRAAERAAGDERELQEADDGSAVKGLPAGADVQRDVAYGADPRQRLDVYLPPSGMVRQGVVLMVHGGGWRHGDKAMGSVVANKAAHWLSQGLVFVSVNYRMLPEANPLQQAEDVARALAFAQSHAPGWQVDPGRFVLAGHSAGAHLVALLTADPSIAQRQGAKPWLGTVPLDSAGYDIVKVMQGRHFKLYDDAFGSDTAFWREASPLQRLQPRPAPLLLVCSSQRRVSCPQAEAFASAARQAGGRATVLPQPLSHREINDRLGLPGAYTDTVDAFLRSLGLAGS
jgi:acetyl esterase/lipase